MEVWLTVTSMIPGKVVRLRGVENSGRRNKPLIRPALSPWLKVIQIGFKTHSPPLI